MEFVPAEGGDGTAWGRTVAASRRLAERFRAGGGGVSQVHDDRSKSFEVAKEYLLAWTALLDDGDPELALCNTVEVQSLFGRTIGLIVLPAHPLRLAWLAAYDNLLLHAVFGEGQAPGQVRKELQALDGAMFPAFLPNPAGGAFVFADTLGFHAVGMVPDDDREPKAAVAVLAPHPRRERVGGDPTDHRRAERGGSRERDCQVPRVPRVVSTAAYARPPGWRRADHRASTRPCAQALWRSRGRHGRRGS